MELVDHSLAWARGEVFEMTICAILYDDGHDRVNLYKNVEGKTQQ